MREITLKAPNLRRISERTKHLLDGGVCIKLHNSDDSVSSARLCETSLSNPSVKRLVLIEGHDDSFEEIMLIGDGVDCYWN